MTHTKSHPNNFGKALKFSRNARQLSQEGFGLVSSRTYISSLERGIGSPTLAKVEQLAEVMGMHPMTLLTLAYMKTPLTGGLESLFSKIENEILQLRDVK